MLEATPEQLNIELYQKARSLRSSASVNRSALQLGKLVSGASVLAGLYGLGAVSWGIIPLVVSMGLYAGSLIAEHGTTRRVMPFPLWQLSLDQVLARVVQENVRQPRLTDFHYMTPDERAEWLLCTEFKGAIATKLKGFDPNQIDELWDRAKRALSEHLEDIEGLPKISQASQTLDALLSDEAPVLPDSVAEIQSVGAQTKLNAVPVEALAALGEDPWEPVSNPHQLNEIAAQSDSINLELPKTETALDALTASPFLSRAFFGTQRAGKSYLVSRASKALSKRGVRTFHVNLASYKDPEVGASEDDEYWSHVAEADSVCCDITAMTSGQAGAEIQKAIALVERFYRTRNSILVFDEFIFAGGATNAHAELLEPLVSLIAAKINILSSNGTKRLLSIWTLGPKMVAGELTPSAKAMKGLSLCFVTVAPGHTVSWQGNAITFGGEVYEQVRKNFHIQEPTMNAALAGCDRIAYINNDWKPIGI